MIDILFVIVIIGYAVSGYRQGLAVGALSLVGFLGGALVAITVVPPLAERFHEGLQRSIVLLVSVLGLAWLGQLLGALIGSRLRSSLTLPGAQIVDQLLGSVAGVIAVSLVLWFVGGAVREIRLPSVAKAIGQSRVLASIDALIPQQFSGVADGFTSALSDSAFPRVFQGLGPEQIITVPAPDIAAMSPQTLARARRSIMKITGDAAACRRGQEGSGAVVAAGRVITNAHVVAGVRAPKVQGADGGRKYNARVVLFDPVTDIAVLSVPGLPTPPLPLGPALGRSSDAALAGYPQNGPYLAVPARVRSVIKAEGEDIYGSPGAVREVYSLYAKVEQGNSGGPLLATDGSLAGVVFAKSLDDASTGYALTLAEVRDEIIAGVKAQTQVSSGPCTDG